MPENNPPESNNQDEAEKQNARDFRSATMPARASLSTNASQKATSAIKKQVKKKITLYLLGLSLPAILVLLGIFFLILIAVVLLS